MRNFVVHTIRRLMSPIFVSAVILCTVILFGLSVRMPMVSAASTPQIIIDPSSAGISVGQTFTMTVNLTNFSNLYLYQVVFKYDGKVLNLTSVWFPASYVFSGQSAVTTWSNDTEAAGDIVDHLNYTVAGASLVGTGSVSVTNGVLCEANFTGLAVGQTTIEIATKSSPAYGESQNTWYTYCQDPPANEYATFVTNTSTVTVPEFGPILLMVMLPVLGIAILITRKKLAPRLR
jgi:hypothetical protein